MKENGELERKDICIDTELDVEYDNNQVINVYIETWFDVDKKFNIDINNEDDTWLNMYAGFNPFEDTLAVECEISRQYGSSYFEYIPTENEAKLIKDMIIEKIQEIYGQTPLEFCNEICNEEQTMGEIK